MPSIPCILYPTRWPILVYALYTLYIISYKMTYTFICPLYLVYYILQDDLYFHMPSIPCILYLTHGPILVYVLYTLYIISYTWTYTFICPLYLVYYYYILKKDLYYYMISTLLYHIIQADLYCYMTLIFCWFMQGTG